MEYMQRKSAAQIIAMLPVLCIANPTRAEDSYDGGILMPSASFEADKHHAAGTFAGTLSFLHLGEGKAQEVGTAIDGDVRLLYSTMTYEASADDAATDEMAPHGTDVLTFDANIHLSFGSWNAVQDTRKHHGFGIQLAGGVSPAASVPTVDRSFAGSVGYTHVAVGRDGDGAEDGFNPNAFHLHLHAGIGVGYWNVPHSHTREIDSVTVEEPHTTSFVAFQFPVFSIEGLSRDNLGLHGAVELRGFPGGMERLTEFRVRGGIAPEFAGGSGRFVVEITLEATSASASVHEYPEHGPDVHITVGPQLFL